MSDQPNTSAAPKTADPVIIVTPTAVQELKRLLSKESEPDLFVRLGVSSGGCSGLSYAMEFDNTSQEFDREFEFDGLKVRVDLKALMYLKGVTLDFKTGLMGGFSFSNPNAKRSCGCGTSFTC